MLFFVAVRYIMQAIELLVPALIMLAIGGIKSGINPKELDASTPIADTPIVTYEAMQNVSTFPNVLCYDNNMFMRCLLRSAVVLGKLTVNTLERGLARG